MRSIKKRSPAKRHQEYMNYIKNPVNRWKIFKRSLIQRKLDSDLTYQEYTDLTGLKCFYCPENASGLDRIDHLRGYYLDNVLPCCKRCNYARGDRFTVDEFQVMMKALTNYKFQKIIKSVSELANRGMEDAAGVSPEVRGRVSDSSIIIEGGKAFSVNLDEFEGIFNMDEGLTIKPKRPRRKTK